jgi:large subunit ribosomal protein L24
MISAEDDDKRLFRSVEKPVPLSSVRLIFPLTDPETGVTRDVIVKKLIIPGLNIKVPWPRTQPKEHEDYAADTLRVDVEVKNFVPTLLTPPMPGSVIDELRNKYSVFRTRHDPEYIAAKMKEDEEKDAAKKLSEQMRTPLKEVNRRERKLKKAKGKGKLTKEMLEKIGQVIAKKRQMALDAAGVSRASVTPMAA